MDIIEKIEKLRKHMLITKGSMAKLLGISRQTYVAWLKGAKIRPENQKKITTATAKLVNIIKQHHWPMPEVRAMRAKQRYEKLLELM